MGRLASGDARKYQIMDLHERHHQILRLTSLGYTPTQVADELGCTTATVGNVVHSELGKRQLELLGGALSSRVVDINEELKRLAPIALVRLEEILTTPDQPAKLVAEISKDILDRAGYGAPKIIQGQFLHGHLTKQDIEDLKKRADAITVQSEDIIDAEVTDAR